MRLNEITYEDGTPIDGYGPGFFRVGGEILEGARLIAPSISAPWAGYSDLQPLLDLAGRIDVLFVGTGKDVAPIPSDMRTQLESAGVGVEIMNSPTACRTYNVLLSEGRRIGLAVLPV